MSTDPRIEAAALEDAADIIWMRANSESGACDADRQTDSYRVAEDVAREVISAYLDAADKAATMDPGVEHFINERPGYIAALKNTRGTDDQSDYWRWSGHAEARRQLATVLGYTVPHEPGETTKRGTE